MRFVMAMPATRAEAVRRAAIRARFMVASLTAGGRVESMKRSDKWVLWLSLGAVAVLLLGALGFAAVENIKADNARIEREQAEEKRLADEANKQRREEWKAYLRTPEGQAEVVRKREAEAAEAQRLALQAGQQKAAAEAEKNWQPSAWNGSVPAVEKWIEARLGAVKYKSWQTSTNAWKVFTTVDFTSRLSREVLTFTVMKSTGKVDSVKSGGVVIWPE